MAVKLPQEKFTQVKKTMFTQVKKGTTICSRRRQPLQAGPHHQATLNSHCRPSSWTSSAGRRSSVDADIDFGDDSSADAPERREVQCQEDKDILEEQSPTS